MAEPATRVNDSDSIPPQSSTGAQEKDAYLAARARFAARRAYKRSLRRARNPLYFSLRSLALLIILVLFAVAVTLALFYTLRGEPPPPLEPIIEILESAKDTADSNQSVEPEATSPPAVQVILAAETPESLVLEGPAIPTVVITNTPVPLSVGVKAAVYGVGNDKLNIRNSPTLTESQVLFRENEGKLFNVIGGPQEADGFTWWQLRDPEYQVEGWAVANYLQTVSGDTGQ